MTVSVQVPYTATVANGLTGTFNYNFKCFAPGDLSVSLNGVIQTTGFTITGIGNDNGGTVDFDVFPAAGVTVLIESKVVPSRDTDYTQFGKLPADILDKDFDRIWVGLQYLLQKISSAIKLPFSTGQDQLLTKSAVERANGLIGFDAAGNVTTIALSAIPVTVSSGSFTVDTFSGNGSQTAFVLSRDPGIKNNTYVYVGGVYVKKADYSVSGTTLTFSTAPAAGTNNIEICQSVALTAGSPADGTVVIESLAPSLSVLENLAQISATLGLVEQTGADTFTKRLIGVANSADVPTRSDTDTRYVRRNATQTLGVGYSGTPHNAGNTSGTTYTPNEANGNLQYVTNNGTWTFAPPSNSTSLCVLVKNTTGAALPTTSGFTKVTGSFTTTTTDEFMCYVAKIFDGTTAFSHLHIQALQ